MMIISHRGAKGLAPENTRASFEAALTTGADMIEFDIRTSADGELVIHHDPTMARLRISKTSYATLKQANQELLTFSEVLKIIGNKRPLLVEIKRGADINLIIRALSSIDLPPGSWLGSFDYRILAALRKAYPQSELLVIHKWSGMIASYRARRLKTKNIALGRRWLYSGYVRALSLSGLKLIPYTLNNPKKIRKWEKSGLYGFVTDYPDILSTEK